MFPSRRSVMAIRISRESLPPTFSNSCATSYSLHLNFMVLVGPGCDIKTLCDGRVQFERINLRLNKRTASMWATTRDKLLEKTLWSRGQQRIVWSVLLALYDESGNSSLNLSGIHVGNLHFTSVVCALGVVLYVTFSVESNVAKVVYVIWYT